MWLTKRKSVAVVGAAVVGMAGWGLLATPAPADEARRAAKLDILQRARDIPLLPEVSKAASLLASASLAFLSRDRVVNLFVRAGRGILGPEESGATVVHGTSVRKAATRENSPEPRGCASPTCMRAAASPEAGEPPRRSGRRSTVGDDLLALLAEASHAEAHGVAGLQEALRLHAEPDPGRRPRRDDVALKDHPARDRVA